ncbi:MAG: transporter substrate-binding domain-containing protein [Eubacteriales bacterium]|jgi:ABC-type amino acid transport substrate-binding protein|nr:transporter substrate-binding domain-containing protein [Clostridiales bacterium]
MKKLIYLLLAAILLTTPLFLFACQSSTDDLAKIKESGVIRVGMECDYAPFNWTQAEPSDYTVPITSGGYADGYDLQIARKIADELGVKLEVVKIEWGGLPSALQTGEIDAIIAGMSPIPSRRETIDFSDGYYISDLVIVVRKDSPYANATKLSDFAGAKLTAQLDTFHYTALEEQATEALVQTAMDTFPAMIVALQSDTIDGYVSELPGAKSAVFANSDLTYVTFEEGQGFAASEDELSIAVGLRKGSNLVEEINKILANISDDMRQELMDGAIERQPLSE